MAKKSRSARQSLVAKADRAVKLYEASEGWGCSYTLEAGWSWAPCDSATWMQAATPDGLAPCWMGDDWSFIDATMLDHHRQQGAVDCALEALRARFS